MRDGRMPRHCLGRGAGLLLLASAVAPAADLSVLGGPWSASLDASWLEAGAGSEFASPAVSDVLVAVLSISNTGGANWSVSIAREGNEALWPPGVTVALKRGGGSAEAGISDGLTYQVLASDPQPFFSGTGDYPSVEILLRLDGVSTQTSPGPYSLVIRYAIDVQ
jgi:hypothetical protein